MKAIITAICSALCAMSLPVFAGDVEAGKEKAKVCAACHGVDGNSQSGEFPRLAGQHNDYLLRALEAYKSGARKNPLMAPMVEKLTKRDMEDLAAYFSAQHGLYTKR